MNTDGVLEKRRNVAQLVRASSRQGEGRRFESDHSYQFNVEQSEILRHESNLPEEFAKVRFAMWILVSSNMNCLPQFVFRE